MADIVSQLRTVRELYPEERIAESRARLQHVWDRKLPEDRIPYVFSSFPFSSRLHGLRMDFACHDVRTSLAYQLDAMTARAVLSDDYIPALLPGMRSGAIPTAFGCEELAIGEQFHVRPVVQSAADIYRLRAPDLAGSGFTHVVLERIRRFRELTSGQLPIHSTDMQGPFSTACALWDDQALMLAMIDEPEAVRFLMDLTTEAFIEFMKLQIDAAEGDIIPIHCMPFAWMPLDKGVCVSEDYLALLSPSTCTDFLMPCLERIAEAFGGIVVHSCGDFRHNLNAIANVKGLLGINFGVSETPLAEIVDVLGTEVVLLPHATEVSSCEVPVISQAEHIRYSMGLAKQRAAPMLVQVFVDPASASGDEVLQLDELASKESRSRKE